MDNEVPSLCTLTVCVVAISCTLWLSYFHCPTQFSADPVLTVLMYWCVFLTSDIIFALEEV